VNKGPISIVGWRERVDIPDLGLTQVRAKVDTGARTSSLHAQDLELVRVSGRPRVRFSLDRDADKPEVFDLSVREMRWVKSSNGARQHRPVIRVQLILGGLRWRADLTLTTRDTMGFPMLLGREALRGRFLIDPNRSFLQKPPETKT